MDPLGWKLSCGEIQKVVRQAEGSEAVVERQGVSRAFGWWGSTFAGAGLEQSWAGGLGKATTQSVDIEKSFLGGRENTQNTDGRKGCEGGRDSWDLSQIWVKRS